MLRIKLFFLLACFTNSLRAESFLLPNATEPESYTLLITTNVPAPARRFTGLIILKIKVLENTHEIFLHSRQHTINSWSLEERIGTQTVELENVIVERENSDVIKITSEKQLEAGSHYELIIEYQGNLLLASDGFFRSDYVVNVNGSDVYTWQAATHFHPFSARHAFPCYDSLQNNHRATFQVSLTHDATYTAISTMEKSSDNIRANMIETFFFDTPKLPPSSLAFFVSGFEEIRKETSNGLRHLVSVRATEADHTVKFFEKTDEILNAVESFMRVKLPHGVLTSVLLPNYDHDVSAFFGFNYYREDLVLFYPLVSPFSKEFQIAKLVTSGIVSQYLGNLASLDSWNDAWIFRGLSKFLSYEIHRDDEDFVSDEMFISDVLHPILHRQSYPAAFPSSAEDATSKEAVEKAACTFRMIYHAIGSEAFRNTFHHLIEENSFKSIAPAAFYQALQEAAQGIEPELEIDLRSTIEGFMMQKANSIVTVHRYPNAIVRVIKKPLVMPYNFITSSMDAPSDIKWFDATIEEILTIPTSDSWFLLNVNQFGFYRVNYDVDNWIAIVDALTDNHTVFSTNSRAQLIDDSLSLAREGFLSYETVMSLLNYLVNESSFLPWNAATKSLSELSNLLSTTDVHQRYQDFMLELSEKFVSSIGYEDLAEDTAVEKMTRVQMIAFACSMGSETCLQQMYIKLRSCIDDDLFTLPVYLQPSVFCYGLKASTTLGDGPLLAETLWRKMQKSDNSEYRLRVIDALGCYNDVKGLFDLLETILASTAEVRYLISENFEVIQSVYSKTTEGVEATLGFYTEFQSDAVRRTQKNGLVEILAEELSKRIFDQRLKDKLMTMMEVLNVSAEGSAKAVDVVDSNLAWQNEAVTSITNWFNRDTETTTEQTSTEASAPPTLTTEVTSTESTTSAGEEIMLSTALGIAWTVLSLSL